MDLIFLKYLHEAGTQGNEIAVMAMKIFQVGCAHKICCEDRFSISMSGMMLGQRHPRCCAASPREGLRPMADLCAGDTGPTQSLNFCHNITLINPLTASLTVAIECRIQIGRQRIRFCLLVAVYDGIFRMTLTVSSSLPYKEHPSEGYSLGLSSEKEEAFSFMIKSI